MARTKETGSGFIEEEAFKLEDRTVLISHSSGNASPTLQAQKYTIVHPDTTPTLNPPHSLETE